MLIHQVELNHLEFEKIHNKLVIFNLKLSKTVKIKTDHR